MGWDIKIIISTENQMKSQDIFIFYYFIYCNYAIHHFRWWSLLHLSMSVLNTSQGLNSSYEYT